MRPGMAIGVHRVFPPGVALWAAPCPGTTRSSLSDLPGLGPGAGRAGLRESGSCPWRRSDQRKMASVGGFRLVDERVEQGASQARDRAFARIPRDRIPEPALVVDGGQKTLVAGGIAEGGGRKAEGNGQAVLGGPVHRHETVGAGKGEQSDDSAETNSVDVPEGTVGIERESGKASSAATRRTVS